MSRRRTTMLLAALAAALLGAGLLGAPAPAYASGVVAIEAGGSHTCVLMADGGVKCWGANGAGQIGNGEAYAIQLRPTEVQGLDGRVVQLSAGSSHNCALMEDGGLKCWGFNAFGELGDGTTTDRYLPVEVCREYDEQAGRCREPLTDVVDVSAGVLSTCAVIRGGSVKCWGINNWGQLGVAPEAVDLCPDPFGPPVPRASSEPPIPCSTTLVDVTGLNSGVVSVESDSLHTCAVMDTGGVKCWGLNFAGELGDGTGAPPEFPGGLDDLPFRPTPADVCAEYDAVAGQCLEPFSDAVSVAVGDPFSCALTTEGIVVCWGTNYEGRLGTGSACVDILCVEPVPVPVVELEEPVVALQAGANYACALMANQRMKCWGSDERGQLGAGGPSSFSSTPIRVCAVDTLGLCAGPLRPVGGIGIGGFHGCALMATGEIKCWGSNLLGQLGTGQYGHNLGLPTDVVGLDEPKPTATPTVTPTATVMPTPTATSGFPTEVPTPTSTSASGPPSIRPSATELANGGGAAPGITLPSTGSEGPHGAASGRFAWALLTSGIALAAVGVGALRFRRGGAP